MGQWLIDKSYIPDLVLCSDAARTRETALCLFATMTEAPVVRYMPALYNAGSDDVLRMIRAETSARMCVIGHNPGIGMLAQMLVRNAPDHPRFDDYPTCATTVLEFAGDIAAGQGTCLDFIVPRDQTD
jgi:phosphohistidine phosphatase